MSFDAGKLAALLEVPAHRRAPLEALIGRLRTARRVVLTTHVNADGDGAGSQAAIAVWLAGQGVEAAIVNPTPFPAYLRFVLDPRTRVADWGGAEAAGLAANADLLLVLDTSEPARIGPLAAAVPRERTLVIDHHPPSTSRVADAGLLDPAAAATGELVFDLISLATGGVPEGALLGIYVAIVTDTGSFRYSNTTPRAHAIAAELLARGVDPEAVYQRLYATVPLQRVALLRAALEALEHERETGLSWIVLTRERLAGIPVTTDDFEGLIEHARSLEGTEVAMLFRELEEGGTKVSFRSNGRVDVNRIARGFGGGGHVKAAGATLPGPAAIEVPRVLAAVRTASRG